MHTPTRTRRKRRFQHESLNHWITAQVHILNWHTYYIHIDLNVYTATILPEHTHARTVLPRLSSNPISISAYAARSSGTVSVLSPPTYTHTHFVSCTCVCVHVPPLVHTVCLRYIVDAQTHLNTYTHVGRCMPLTSHTPKHVHTHGSPLPLSLVTHIVYLLFFTDTFCVLHFKVHTSGHSGLSKQPQTHMQTHVLSRSLSYTHTQMQICRHLCASKIRWNHCLCSVWGLILCVMWWKDGFQFQHLLIHKFSYILLYYLPTTLTLYVLIFIFTLCTYTIYSIVPLETSIYK